MNGRMFGDFVCAGVLAFVAFGAQASAQRCTWTGAGGDRKWSTAANWDVLPVSGRGDTVVLRSCAGEAVDISPIEIDVAGMSVATLEIGDSAGPYGPVTLTGNALEVTGNKP